MHCTKCRLGRLCGIHTHKSLAHQRPMFYQHDDVVIPTSGDFGYVSVIAPDVQEAYVISHDGGASKWYRFDELAHLTADAS